MVLIMNASLSNPSHFAAPPVVEILEKVITPGRFFVSPSIHLAWRHEVETIPWELYRGHVLDRTRTRERQTFESWNLCEPSDPEPVLSIKFCPATNTLFVTRSIRCHTHEVTEERGLLQTRPVVRRIRELIGTVSLQERTSLTDLHDELVVLLTRAVVGCHRLPITSLESPMPEFSCGLLTYSSIDPTTNQFETCPKRWFERNRASASDRFQSARLLEFAIRSTSADRIGELAHHARDLGDMSNVLRTMFCQVSLAPYTDFVPKALDFVDALVQVGAFSEESRLDWWCWLLRLLTRHLSSFDLIDFHHRGANYPDALLLEELTRRLDNVLSVRPSSFMDRPDDPSDVQQQKRLRRRAVRQTWLIRRENQGLVVPSRPTTPGESQRVIPPFPVPLQDDAKAWQPSTRTLFSDESILHESSASVRQVLEQSILDLSHSSEVRELGVGLFLDRPLGYAKAVGEPDLTLMFSHECHSFDLASRRLALLAKVASPPCGPAQTEGISWQCHEPRRRAGVVSLQDMQISRFAFRPSRTTQSSLREFQAQYQLASPTHVNLWRRIYEQIRLLVPSSQSAEVLVGYDMAWQCRLKLQLDTSEGYAARRGTEFLRRGLTIIEAKDEMGHPINSLRGESLLPAIV